MIKAIVIDDDKDLLNVFCEYLSIKGLDVIGIANNGKEGKELYQKLRPDIVLCDVMMPKYDGFYALERIRKIDPRAIVIMVTADMSMDTERRLIEMESSGIIYKPYEIDQIMSTIERVLDNQKMLVSKL